MEMVVVGPVVGTVLVVVVVWVSMARCEAASLPGTVPHLHDFGKRIFYYSVHVLPREGGGV